MEFEEKLEVGCNFEEEIALPFLLDMFTEFWITPTHAYKLSKKGNSYYGPRMHRKGQRSLIMPDFELTGPCNMFIEAKYKTQPFSKSGHYPKKFIAIEESKCLQYEEVAKIKNMGLLYLIGCEETRTLHMVKPEEYLNHIFDNEHGSGPVRAFEINDTNKVGDF